MFLKWLVLLKLLPIKTGLPVGIKAAIGKT